MSTVHPTSTASDGRLRFRRTTYAPYDKKQELLGCAQCGLPFRVGKDSSGDSLDSPGITFQSAASFGTNFLTNGSFEQWALGSSFSNPPNNATIADKWLAIKNAYAGTLTVAKDLTVFSDGVASCRLDFSASDAAAVFVRQYVPNFAALSSYTIQVTAQVKASVSNAVFLVINDGLVTTTSGAHSGGGSFETLSLTYKMLPTSMQLRVDVGYTGGVTTPASSIWVDTAVVNVFKLEPVVQGGCRYCGSFNPRAIGRNKDFDIYKKNLEGR